MLGTIIGIAGLIVIFCSLFSMRKPRIETPKPELKKGECFYCKKPYGSIVCLEAIVGATRIYHCTRPKGHTGPHVACNHNIHSIVKSQYPKENNNEALFIGSFVDDSSSSVDISNSVETGKYLPENEGVVND